MRIRQAIAGDAEPASLILRRSITELCTLDHENDPALLASWLANKTPEKFRDWVRSADDICFVAIAEDNAILGVGLLSKAGEIKLNYVSPDNRFRGVSSALIEAMEAEAQGLGVTRITLNSTATAHRFYQAGGYKDEGKPQTGRLKVATYPMSKRV